MWRRKKSKSRIVRKPTSTSTRHYKVHKEAARALITERVTFYNHIYKLEFNRIAIKNQRRCWGSCSSLKNLNFNYKLLFLPEALQDYIVVHELCHLKEMNHGPAFWQLVAVAIPDYKERICALKRIEQKGIAKLLK